MRTGCVSLHEVTNFIYEMSRVEICSLAYEGKVNDLKEKIGLKQSLATQIDENERMPLHWAASGGHTDIVKYLLDLRVPIDEKDDCKIHHWNGEGAFICDGVHQSQWTPLMIAASAGRDVIIVSSLIDSGADVNSTNEGGQTSLHYAASRNRYEIAELLLHNGANVNTQDKTSAATPLHRAASKGHSKMVKLLLKQNANCDIQDAEGNTALHMACEEGRAEIAVTLVENGANLYIQNKMNQSPVEVANKGLARQLIHLCDS